MSTIKIARGLKANMPTLQDGQQYFCTDTDQMYVGRNGETVDVTSKQLSGTYNEIKALKDSKSLKPGYQYLITDYKTIYQQPVTNVIKISTTEKLVLTAISTDRFDRQCSSLNFPQDFVWYDFDNVTCEDGVTSRPGFILRRHDTIRNINCPHDWRKIQYARFRVDTTSIVEWVPDMAVTAETLYIVGSNIVKSAGTGIPLSSSDRNYFGCPIIENYATNYCLAENNTPLVALKTTFKEVLTFQGSAYNIYIDDYLLAAKPILSNNTFGSVCYNITFGLNCYNNTFAVGCYNIIFGPGCHSNRFGEDSYNITFGPSCYRNIFGNRCLDITFDSGCYGNAFGVNCYGNKFDSVCCNNTLGHICYNNKFGIGCSGNILAQYSKNNAFGPACIGNRLSRSDSNTFGSACSNNIFGDCGANTFDSISISNKNLTAIGDMNSKSVTTTTSKNASGKSVYMKLDANNVPVYTVIP